mmetsp:Transcript_22283/g.35482  ORF Transcript_22283/g.35482 Transcript_22283/m.35482 type:complete len:194 (-) Transcript_22283:6443-7024(-)
MDTEKQATGRKKVRQHLIDPLNAMGMTRKRAMKVDRFKKMQTSLADRLAYMTADNLDGLREYTIRLAGGNAGNTWPDEVSIVRAAFNIQRPPPQQSSYAQSLIRSAMGRRAHDEGWLVELYQVAKRMGPPPGRYIITKLKDRAEDNRRKRLRVAEYIESGRVTPDERNWLAQYHADLDDCMSIINDADKGAQA